MSDGLTESRERVGDLTADERAELDELRAEREKANAVPEDEPESTLPDTHWIHLANGDVFTGKGSATHVGGVPVIGVYAIPDELQEGAEERAAETAHKF
jgi:hypothetical protein